MCVPLRVQGLSVGAISLARSEGRRAFRAEDLDFARELAHRASAALENARTFRESQEANRVKDEFLATISHELRTPLNAILGWTTMLRRKPDVDAKKALDTIERNARAQMRLIEDVLDVSRAVTGKLQLETSDLDLVEVLRASLEVVTPMADGREVTLDTRIEGGPLQAVGRPRSTAAGVVERADERDQVHGQGGTRRRSPGAKRFAGGGRGRRHGSRHRRRLPSVRVRPIPAGRQLHDARRRRARARSGDREAHRRAPRRDRERAEPRRGVRHHLHHRAPRSGSGRRARVRTRWPAEGVVGRLPLAGRGREDPGASQASGSSSATTTKTRAICSSPCSLPRARRPSRPRAAERLSMPSRSFGPHVLVSDVGMPHFDGYQLIGQVRAMTEEEGGQTPAIALTAYARREDELKALLAGYQVHVTKPIDPGRLVEMVANLVGRPPCRQPGAAREAPSSRAGGDGEKARARHARRGDLVEGSSVRADDLPRDERAALRGTDALDEEVHVAPAPGDANDDRADRSRPRAPWRRGSRSPGRGAPRPTRRPGGRRGRGGS